MKVYTRRTKKSLGKHDVRLKQKTNETDVILDLESSLVKERASW